MEEFRGWRAGLLVCAVVIAAFLALGAELLSLLTLFEFWPVLFLWVLAGAWVAIVLYRQFEKGCLTAGFRDWTHLDLTLFLTIGVLLAIALASAVLFPPNSWDSMVYHLPRQVRWIQQGSLAHFGTHHIYQLYQPPLAEIINAQLMILTSSDHLLGLVQWVALVLSLCASSLIAKQLGTSRRGQLLTGLLCLSVPSAFMQASSTKNDLLLSLWFLVLAWLALRLHQGTRCGNVMAVLIGCGLGLLLLTKGTALILGLPLCVFTGFTLVRRCGRGSWKPALIICLCVVALNAGHAHRNYDAFGTPLIPTSGRRDFQNQALSPGLLLSRVLRETSHHLGTPLQGLNQFFENSISWIHQALGLDLNDSRTTWPNARFGVRYRPYDEYQAGAPVHLFLIAAFFVLLYPLRRVVSGNGFWLLLSIPPACFLLLCALLKWIPTYGSRSHLALLLLMAPLLGRLFSSSRLARFIPGVVLLLLLGLVTTVRRNPRSVVTPSLLFRAESKLLFAFEPDYETPFKRAAAFVRSLQPSTVGLDGRGAWNYEYPMMRLLKDGTEFPRFEAFNVANGSRRFQEDYRPPDVVVVLRPVSDQIDAVTRTRLPRRQADPFHHSPDSRKQILTRAASSSREESNQGKRKGVQPA